MRQAAKPPNIAELRMLVPEFCKRHDVTRLELFGSVLRNEVRPDSDVDLLVTFRQNAHPGLDFFSMQDELESLLGCRIDLLTRRSVEQSANHIRRRSILESVQEIYAG